MSRSRVFIFLLSRLYIYSFLLSKFPRKFLKRGRAKGEAKESILQHPRRSSTPLDCTRRGSENGISFLRRARGTFSSKESILRKAGRESNVSQSGWKKGKDGSVTKKRVSNARALPPRGGESQTTSPSFQRFLLPSPIPFSFHRVKNLGDFSTSSAHVAAPLKGEDSNFSGNALCGVSSVRLSRSFHESHDLRASLLLRVHTPCSSSSCAHTSVPRKMSICRANDSRLAQYAPGWLSTLDSTRKRERDRERGFLCSSRHGLVLPIP